MLKLPVLCIINGKILNKVLSSSRYKIKFPKINDKDTAFFLNNKVGDLVCVCGWHVSEDGGAALGKQNNILFLLTLPPGP